MAQLAEYSSPSTENTMRQLFVKSVYLHNSSMELHLLILVVFYVQQAIFELLTCCMYLQIKGCKLQIFFHMTYYSSLYKVLDFLTNLQLQNEKNFLSTPTGASRDLYACLHTWLNKMRCGFVSYMLFSLLQIAVSIKTHSYSEFPEPGQALPGGTKPTSCEGVTLHCSGFCKAAQLSSAQCLTPLLKCKIFSIRARSVFERFLSD